MADNEHEIKVKVSADTSGADKIKKEIENLGKIKSSVNIDDTKLISALRKVAKEADKVSDKERKIKFDIDISKFNEKLKNIKSQLNLLTNKTHQVKLGINTLGATTGIERVKKQLDKIDGRVLQVKTHTTNTTIKNTEKTNDRERTTTTTDSAPVRRNTYLSLQREANEYARRAEMAWRNAGNLPDDSFQRFADKYQATIDKLISFRKSLGNISANQEANIIKNQIRKMDTSTPLYDKMLQKVRQLKREQAELNARIREGQRGSGVLGGGTGNTPRSVNSFIKDTGSNLFRAGRLSDYWGSNKGLANLEANSIRFLGRSSKGIGSFGEALAGLTSKLAMFGELATTASIAIGSIVAPIALFGSAVTILTGIAERLGSILLQVFSYIKTALQPGIELYETRSKAELAIQAGIMSQGKIDGRNVTSSEAQSAAQQLVSKSIMDALYSVFNPQELISALQGTLPILLNRGLSVAQAYDISKGVAGVAKLTKLAPNQVLQEVRDIAQGTITARSSQVANILGIRNEDLAKFKEDSDEFYAYLMDKFKNYTDILKKYAETPIGAYEQLQEMIAVVGDSIVNDLAGPFAHVFNTITQSMGSLRDANNRLVNSFGDLVDEEGNLVNAQGNRLEDGEEPVKGEGKISFQPSEIFSSISDSLKDLIMFMAGQIDDFVQTLFSDQTPQEFLEKLVVAVKAVGVVFVWVIEILSTLVESGQGIVGVFIKIGEVLGGLITTALALTSPLLGIISALVGFDSILSFLGSTISGVSQIIVIAIEAIDLMTASIRMLATGVIKFVNSILHFDFSGAGKAFTDAFTNSDSVKRFEKRWDSLTNDAIYLWNSSKTNKEETQEKDKGFNPKDWSLTDLLKEGEERAKKAQQALQNGITNVDLDKIKGTAASDKDNANAQKQTNKAIRDLKNELAKKLDEIKDQLKQNELKYKQGFMTINEYYSQKAEAEAEEARLRLETAQKTYDLIENTEYKDPMDKENALAEAARDIRKYTRELSEATKDAADVSRAIVDGTQQFANYFNRRTAQAQLQNTQTGGSITQALYSKFNSFDPQEPLENMRVACVEAVDKLLADINPVMKEALDSAIYNTEALEEFLKERGVEVTDYIKENLKPGDIIMYDGAEENQHVMVYAGNNKLLGNSSSANGGQGGLREFDIDDYDSLIPTRILKTSAQSIYSKIASTASDGFVQQLEYYGKNGYEARQVIEDIQKNVSNMMGKYESDIIGAYQDQVNNILDDSNKQIRGLKNKLKDNPTVLEPAIQAVQRDTQKKLVDLLTSVHEKQLNFLMTAQTESNFGWGDVAANREYENPKGYKNLLKRNFDHIFSPDENNPYNPAAVINQLWEDYAQYQKSGFLGQALDIRNTILNAYNKVYNMFDGWIEQYEKYFDQYGTWLGNNLDATSLQKEYGGREITARKNEAIYEAANYELSLLQPKIDQSKKLYEEASLALDNIEEESNRLEEEIKLLKQKIALNEEDEDSKQRLADLEKKLSEVSDSKSELQTQKDIQSQIRNSLAIRERAVNLTRLQAEVLKDQPDIMRDFHRVSKQALEDGLVKFLTDGILEAENLGQALRELLTGILKEMQQFFAKQLVLGMMNGWFPVQNQTDEQNRKVDPFALGTNYLNTYGRQYDLNSQFRGIKDNPFAGAWETSSLNKNQQFTFNTPDLLDTATIEPQVTELNTNMMNLSSSITQFSTTTTGIEQTNSQNSTLLINAMQMNTAALNQLTNAMATQTTTTTTQSVRAGVWTGGIAIGNKIVKSFARGGMVRGAGTSVSDSIPAMLSNGEAVLNAMAVRKLGANFIHAVNRGDFTKIKSKIPHLAMGGIMGDIKEEAALGMNNFAKNVGTSVSTSTNMNVALVRDEREAMEHFMRSPRGQRVMLDFSKGNASVRSRISQY